MFSLPSKQNEKRIAMALLGHEKKNAGRENNDEFIVFDHLDNCVPFVI